MIMNHTPTRFRPPSPTDEIRKRSTWLKGRNFLQFTWEDILWFPVFFLRATNGGFLLRYQPRAHQLERVPSGWIIPNPWGNWAFDNWGQNFYAQKPRGPNVNWKCFQDHFALANGNCQFKGPNLIEKAQIWFVYTSGLEFIHSRHFPEWSTGRYDHHNTIGFLGNHTNTSNGGRTRSWFFTHKFPPGPCLLYRSVIFRPVDMEFAAGWFFRSIS